MKFIIITLLTAFSLTLIILVDEEKAHDKTKKEVKTLQRQLTSLESACF